MKLTRANVWVIGLCVAVLVQPRSLVHAQAQAATDTGGVKPTEDPGAVAEIVVTAQRREQRLMDVPVADTVVSGSELERQNITSLADLSAHLADVKITTGVLVELLNVRGVGSGNNAGFEQSVGTFVDGVYRERSRSARAALFDVDRVEVLKGPQTTFFGANAIAGALNITTRKPGDEFSYDASTLYRFGDGGYDTEGGVTLPISPTLSVRTAVRVSGMEGYVTDNVSEGESDIGPNVNNRQGRVSARWEPNSVFRSDFRLDSGSSRTQTAYPFEIIGCPTPAPFPTPATSTCGRALALANANGETLDDTLNEHSDSPGSFANYDFDEGAWTNAAEIGSGTLTALTGYFFHNYSGRIQDVPVQFVSPVAPGLDGLPLQTKELYHQLSQELRYQSRLGGFLEYMFGMYYASSNLAYQNNTGFFYNTFGANPSLQAAAPGVVTGATPITAMQLFHEDAHTYSGFASATLRPFDGARINLGARYTSVHKDDSRENPFGTSLNDNPSTFVPFTSPALQTALGKVIATDIFQFPYPTRTDSKFMPSVGLQYDVSSNLMSYVTWSTGFKAGGYNFASRAISFNPETVNAYEAGLKGEFFNRQLAISADVFRSNYKDLQETTVVFGGPSPVSIVTNAAQARSQGVELNVTERLNAYVSVVADLAYLDARYLAYPNGACTILGSLPASSGVPGSGCISQNMDGKRRPYSPDATGNVGLNFAVPQGQYEARIDPSVNFTSAFFESATADPLLRQRGYAKLDLQISYGPSDGHWDVSVIGKNLNDKITAGFRQAIAGTTGSVLAIPDAPRTVALQFAVKN